jgi:hypothetical protein
MIAHRLPTTVLLALGVLAGGLVLPNTPALALGPPEKPVTEAATAITATTATLHGELNPGVATGEVGYYFAYSAEEACPGSLRAPEPPGVIEGNHKAVAAPLTGLVPNTVYTFCLIAMNPSGSTEGAARTFTTLGAKPAVDSESSSRVTPSDALLEGQVNPENQATSYHFEYATNPSMTGAKAVGEASISAGFGDQSAGPADIGGGLESNTTYYYRLVATNATGTTEGSVQEFMTLPNPPEANTGQASSLTPSSATISGSVTPGSVGPNSDTTYFFQYGPTMSYGAQAPLTPGDAGEGNIAISKEAALSGLEHGTTYHYRIVATNDNANTPQTSYGGDRTFTTLSTPPILSGVSVSGVTQSSATITATLDSQGLPARYELQLGSTPGLLQAQAFGNTAGAAVFPLTLTVGSLSPGTLYYYKLIATNLNGTAESPTGESFTTVAGPSASRTPLTQPPTPPLLTTATIDFPSEATDGGTTVAKTRGLTNAQKLANVMKACRKKPIRERPSCERLARRKYGRAGRHRKRHEHKRAAWLV